MLPDVRCPLVDWSRPYLLLYLRVDVEGMFMLELDRKMLKILGVTIGIPTMS